ncbi:MAG: BNR-4 repeat-containing protein [Verrucomicrobia bacterium]|nr:BNR-4 repeat-containing protein [Verrucomicrobiota bacterium]
MLFPLKSQLKHQCWLMLGAAFGALLWQMTAAMHAADTIDNSPPSPVTGKIAGYRGIWFDLGQKSEYGSKYSGGLGTYTAKHCPLAIYDEDANKTFFVFGGTTQANETHLLAMIGYYDHTTGQVPQPTVVHDKLKVNDPHDNPAIAMDPKGHLWVFVSGRGRHRPGYKYRSRKPYDIGAFDQISEEEFTYPQPWWIEEKGCLHLFTKYTKGRELYRNRSQHGLGWTEDQKLAGMGGHYQISRRIGSRVMTAFNYHPNGNVDYRTNLYFLQASDLGETWQTVSGDKVLPPLTETDNPALVKDYQAEDRLVYLKDITVDGEGNPVILHITSDKHQPGPHHRPREWTIAHWQNGEWIFQSITRAFHNYDMGSIYIEPDKRWRLIAPTHPGPQRHSTGGEMMMWIRPAEILAWNLLRTITVESPRNHGYARRPVNAHPDFYAFWADGNPDTLTASHLYFTNKDGTGLWKLPYDMKTPAAIPERLY